MSRLPATFYGDEVLELAKFFLVGTHQDKNVYYIDKLACRIQMAIEDFFYELAMNEADDMTSPAHLRRDGVDRSERT